MSGKVFFDTNVLVYARDDRDPRKQRIAGDLIREAGLAKVGVISYEVVQEFFNVFLVKASQKMTVADAQTMLTDVFSPMLSVHFSANLFVSALRIHERYRQSW